MARLAGTVALVTGGASGIGAATAERLAADGAAVVVGDVAVDPGRAVADAAGGVFHRLDVASEDDWRTVVAATGGFDVLVHCGAVPGSFAGLVDVSLADWNRVLAVNATRTFLALKHSVPAMIARGGGSVVLVGSIFGVRGVPEEVDYSAAKAAVSLLGKNASVTYARDGVRVNTLLPGLIDTPMSRLQDETTFDALARATPMRRAAQPAEVAAVAAFLASDDASFVTGVELPVDGGYLARGEV